MYLLFSFLLRLMYLVPNSAYIDIMYRLTCDFEGEGPAHFWLRGYLTLVGSCIVLLHKLDLQRPCLSCCLVPRSEPLVRDEGVTIYRQDVRVLVPHP